ncbi:hypothetical protein STCU_11881 [Strigomonas culicis]|uniref:Uncharacterized protein n=1 Tax=Strigomonas culicis TaxID=28005 RepID=S9TCA8_9TRYP|nr:hypothetical protein STCU_11881 [Strigomonas culicis]|eukprot:EPY15627.1 hypothetical protein STCU_11881 [Strigomonas culicis]
MGLSWLGRRPRGMLRLLRLAGDGGAHSTARPLLRETYGGGRRMLSWSQRRYGAPAAAARRWRQSQRASPGPSPAGGRSSRPSPPGPRSGACGVKPGCWKLGSLCTVELSAVASMSSST